MDVENIGAATEMEKEAESLFSEDSREKSSEHGSGDSISEISADVHIPQHAASVDDKWKSPAVMPPGNTDSEKESIEDLVNISDVNEANSVSNTFEQQQSDASSLILSERNSQKSSKTADQQKSNSSAGKEEAMASSVKEGDVKDECLSSSEEKEDEWMDILGNGQLKKKVLTAGVDSSRPVQGELVKVKVMGQLEDGSSVFDSTDNFILGDGDVIPAIDMSVALMNQGESAEVFTAARFAFGSQGREPDIPGDSSLTLTLELQDVQPSPDINKLTAEERLSFGEQKRLRGNELFERKDYSSAISSYSKATKFLEAGSGGLSGETSLLQKLLDTKLKCYNNMAASQLKIGANDAAIRSTEEVLKSQPENVKALYRQGKAYGAKGETEKGVSQLEKAIKLDPQSKLLSRELCILLGKQTREMEYERTMYRKMMGNMADAAVNVKKEKSKGTWKWSIFAGGVVAAVVSVGIAYFRSSH